MSAPSPLRSFCAAMIDTLAITPPDRFIASLLHARYDLMSEWYPHDPFSVNEGTPSFFADTLTYLTNGIPETRPGTEPEDAKHDLYWRRYRDWMRKHI